MIASPLVAVFAFNRPGHLERCLASLEACTGSDACDVRVYCDGPRSRLDDVECMRVRTVAGSARKFRSIQVVARKLNLGLSRSVIDGVSECLQERESVIVVEDDLVLSPRFLEFITHGLDLYRGDDRVASIHGYVYPVEESLPGCFFLRGADCWGWGTWRRAWSHFEEDGSILLKRLQSSGLERSFNLDGAMDFSRMLRDQIAGRNDSWAIRWHASCFLRGMFTLYPGVSLVENHGFDGSGRHSSGVAASWNGRGGGWVAVEQIPVEENHDARLVLGAYLRSRRQLPRRLLGVWRALAARIHRFMMART